MAYAVLVPERFRGGCPFGVIVVDSEPDELSRGPCWLLNRIWLLALSRSTPPTSSALGKEERLASLFLRSAARDTDAPNLT
jgi:hypothetical protein